MRDDSWNFLSGVSYSFILLLSVLSFFEEDSEGTLQSTKEECRDGMIAIDVPFGRQSLPVLQKRHGLSLICRYIYIACSKTLFTLLRLCNILTSFWLLRFVKIDVYTHNIPHFIFGFCFVKCYKMVTTSWTG
jgi:hypothetical protein